MDENCQINLILYNTEILLCTKEFAYRKLDRRVYIVYKAVSDKITQVCNVSPDVLKHEEE